jgi:hypothetical protein
MCRGNLLNDVGFADSNHGPQMFEVPELNKLLRKAFLTALLLTGTVEQAETAVLQGITSLDLDENRANEDLLSLTVSAAIETKPDVQISPEELKRPASILPGELQGVMYLSRHLRHCFLLRVLLGWSREIAARLLHLEIRQIDERTRSAVVRLAFIDNVFLSIRTKASAKAC